MRNDDAWFVKSATGFNYRPVRWAGWVVLAVYVAAILALTPLLFRFRTLYYALLVFSACRW